MEPSERDDDHPLCCIVKSMFGYSLKKSVIVICLITISTASLALVLSLVGISTTGGSYATSPLPGVGLLFGLYCIGIASYQIFISTVLLWTTVMKNGSIYVCSIWYISHLSILFGYSCFFIAVFVTCIGLREYVYGVLICVIGIIYTCAFGYFCAVVNSYSYVLGGPLYY